MYPSPACKYHVTFLGTTNVMGGMYKQYVILGADSPTYLVEALVGQHEVFMLLEILLTHYLPPC
jgi:hypothetical protein